MVMNDGSGLNELAELNFSDINLIEIMDHSGHIFMLSPEGRFIFVSQCWANLLGYEKSELLGQSYEKFVHQDNLSNFKNKLSTKLESMQIEPVEYQMKRKDETFHWYTSRISPLADNEGSLKYFLVFVADINEQKQAETALRISEERFSKAFQCNPDPISIATIKNGKYIEVNDAWVETAGFQRDEAIGHTVREINIWENPRDREMVVKTLQEQGVVRSLELNFRHKEGGIHACLFSAEIIQMNEEPHLLAVVKDISAWKKTQEELRLSEERFSKAFNASPISMVISSLETGRIIDVNANFCRWSGYLRQELLQKTTIELGLWVDLDQRRLITDIIMNNQSVLDMEVRLKRRNNEQRIGLYSAEGIVINNEPCLLSIITDITERKQAEEKIRYLSMHDKLTGLFNRTFIEEELIRMNQQQSLPISLIMGDVNGLKLVNDALGHQEGDRLLSTVAELLKGACRPEDIIARWGGDEFIILMPKCDRTTAAGVFDQIKLASMRVNDLLIETSISLGLATKESLDQNMDELIREAEDKMYRNKLMESRSARSAFLTSLERTLWTRSYETEEHCQRVQRISFRIGESIKLPESEMDNLKLLASLHDIGKIAIPNSILDKPGRLTPEEWELIKKHPEIGYRIALSSPEMAPIAEAILHHHEHWDGGGYPLGLKEEKIPILARILAIADTFDVMLNGRSYQPAVSSEEICAELRRCSGTQFDPQLVEIAINILV